MAMINAAGASETACMARRFVFGRASYFNLIWYAQIVIT